MMPPPDDRERFEGLAAHFVAFRLDASRYALPLVDAERVLPMVAVSPLPKAPDVALGVVNVRGTILPVIDLRRRFGRPRRDPGVGGHLLVARTRRRRLVLAVDEVEGVVQIAAADVAVAASLVPGLGYLAGVAALPDGLVLIHDVDTLLALDEEAQLDAGLAEAIP